MPLILTSRTPWRRRPSGLVEIDRSSPLVSGLALFDGGWLDRSSSLRPNAPWEHGGLAYSGTRGTGFSSAVQAPNIASASHATIAVWLRTTLSAGIYDDLFLRIGGSNQRDVLSIGRGSYADTALVKLNQAYASATLTGGSGINNGYWHLVAGVVRGANLEVYLDGRLVGGPTAHGLSVTQVGAGWSVAVDDPAAYPLAWSRALSGAEIWALYDPATRWSLYAPLVVRRYFDLGGGGTTYNESLSFSAASSLPISAAATSTAAIGVAATAALSPTGAASASAAVSLAAAAAAVMGGAATASAGLGVAVATALAQSAAATGSVASSFAASAAVGQSGAATVPVGVSVSASTAATMGAAATAAAGVDFSSAAQQTHAVTCLSSVAVAMSALAALSMSDGSTQNVSESVSFTATATQQMAATAVAEAVQTYLVSAGLTHVPAATAGAALALSVSAAIGQQATMQASATIILSAAAHLLLTSSASGDISYTVLTAASETLRAALARTHTLDYAQPTAEEWHN